MSMDETFLPRLREAPTSSQAQFNIFLQRYTPKGDDMYAFVEGRDDPAFYGPLLRPFLPPVRFINCERNKKGVKWALVEFLSRYRADPHVLFFIDRDFDDFLSIAQPTYPYLFCTKWYSVETYLASWDVVRSYLTEVGAVDALAPELDELASAFEVALDSFVQEMAALMTWMLGVRLARLDANLRNIKTKSVVIWSGDRVQAHASFQIPGDAQRVAGQNAPVAETPPSISKMAEDLVATHPWQAWMRGKQLLWFLVHFIEFSVEQLKANGVKSTSRVNLSETNAVELLAPRCQIPHSLKAMAISIRESLGLDPRKNANSQ